MIFVSLNELFNHVFNQIDLILKIFIWSFGDFHNKYLDIIPIQINYL